MERSTPPRPAEDSGLRRDCSGGLEESISASNRGLRRFAESHAGEVESFLRNVTCLEFRFASAGDLPAANRTQRYWIDEVRLFMYERFPPPPVVLSDVPTRLKPST